MIDVRQTDRFAKWLKQLKDVSARRRILARIDRIAAGNLGDVKSLGGGLYEIRISFGPGCRLYYAKAGSRVILLLCAGDKSSQSRDIAAARRMMKEGVA